MKKVIIAILFVLVYAIAIAQTPENRNPEYTATDTTDEGVIYTIVEQMPYFPGGEEALLKYLGKNIKYPEIARDANTQGTIFLTFVIDEDGEVTKVQVLRGLTGKGAKDCADEAVRVVSEMPTWAPGIQNKKAVKVQYNLPLKFTMRSGKKKKSKKRNEE